jgi:hypothetical protein
MTPTDEVLIFSHQCHGLHCDTIRIVSMKQHVLQTVTSIAVPALEIHPIPTA